MAELTEPVEPAAAKPGHVSLVFHGPTPGFVRDRERPPCRHHAPAGLEQLSVLLVARAIHLGDLAREVRALGGEIAKRRAEDVDGSNHRVSSAPIESSHIAPTVPGMPRNGTRRPRPTREP